MPPYIQKSILENPRVTEVHFEVQYFIQRYAVPHRNIVTIRNIGRPQKFP